MSACGLFADVAAVVPDNERIQIELQLEIPRPSSWYNMTVSELIVAIALKSGEYLCLSVQQLCSCGFS